MQLQQKLTVAFLFKNERFEEEENQLKSIFFRKMECILSSCMLSASAYNIDFKIPFLSWTFSTAPPLQEYMKK